jgi:hypothetical protein
VVALAARRDGVTRAAYDEATDRDALIVAHIVRGAIHALAPGDFALYGRALISGEDHELAAQLGQQVQRLRPTRASRPPTRSRRSPLRPRRLCVPGAR